MAEYIRALASMGAGATAFNLMGNLGVRTVSKWAPSYSGVILTGISSTAFFVLGLLTKKTIIPKESENMNPKRNLYILAVTVIGGAVLPHLLAPLTKSKISLTASIGYSILGHFGTNLGLGVYDYFFESKPFKGSFKAFKDAHIEIWDYLRGS